MVRGERNLCFFNNTLSCARTRVKQEREHQATGRTDTRITSTGRGRRSIFHLFLSFKIDVDLCVEKSSSPRFSPLMPVEQEKSTGRPCQTGERRSLDWVKINNSHDTSESVASIYCERDWEGEITIITRVVRRVGCTEREGEKVNV